MANETRRTLIERAAVRLDLRARSTGPMPLTVAATEPSAEPIPFAPATASRMKYTARPDGERISAAISQQPSRRPAAPGFVSVDQSRLRQLSLIDWAGRRTRAAEEFRIIKRQLLEHAANPERSGRGNNLVMITSARPGEGRTFTALNLAISITMERKWEALLIDACDGDNTVASVVRRPPALGWLDLVEDPALDINSAVLETDITNLSVMVPGQRQGHAVEPLASSNMQRLLERLSVTNRKRLVLIDAPSCLDTSDPANLACVVGQTILVVEAHATQQPTIEAALELLSPRSNTYLVLNKNRTR